MMDDYFIAWWNLENLFDVENSTQRSDRLKEILKEELIGWNDEVLNNKISQLAKVVSKMNDGKGPDILGVCEVEDGPVINKLVKKIQESVPRDYKVEHEQYDDKRGIEIGFIFDASKFEIPKDSKTGTGLVFSHHVLREQATRNILQVNIKIKNSNTVIVLIGNHWPSRTTGELQTEPYRCAAADALSYFHKRILEEQGEDTPIIVMGDFNDMPFSRSLMDYAFSTPYIEQVSKSEHVPFFYNLMWPLIGQGFGTFYFGKKEPDPCHNKYTTYPNMLDQFMVSKSIAFEKRISIKKDSVRVNKVIGEYTLFEEKYSYEMPKKFGRPTKCGNPSDEMNKEGFSDHFPISLIIQEGR
ncbi:MAG: endonuclease/exonuclease/phosphatase family protein [Thermoproteota archaeon]|nr:endonuclease/exonuclease/phosphatase family protein [Thermoproteota archaeon]